MVDADDMDLAFVTGRITGATAMMRPGLAAVLARRRLGAVWEAFRRDAGPGPAGPEHRSRGAFLQSDDPRRDELLLWLADHGAPPVAAAASLAMRAVGATRRFGSSQLDLLWGAIELMPPVPNRSSVSVLMEWLADYLAVLRRDERFAESAGEHVTLPLPSRRMTAYRSPEPAGCWAVNLALQSRSHSIFLPPGLISRVQLRLDLEPEERKVALLDAWRGGLQRSEADLLQVDRELQRGEAVLAELSKNSRARDAWALLVGFGTVSRAQLTRFLALSRAGGALIAQQLENRGLARIEAGLIHPDDKVPAQRVSLGSDMSLAAAEVDIALERIDRLLTAS